jgi:hypothetical protein
MSTFTEGCIEVAFFADAVFILQHSTSDTHVECLAVSLDLTVRTVPFDHLAEEIKHASSPVLP